MKIKNLLVSLCLLSSLSYASGHTLEPGQVAVVQKKDGSWIEIKAPALAQKSIGSFLTQYSLLIGSMSAMLGYAAYSYYSGQDPDMAALEKRFEALKSWQLERELK